MELKPIKYKKAYETIIANQIIVWLWSNIYKECFSILDSQTIYNSEDDIRGAIEQGLIYYQDGAFYSKTGRFSNKISFELEKLGAKYSSYRKAYLIDKAKIPTNLLWAVDTMRAQTAQKVAVLQAFLTNQASALKTEEKKLVFDTAVEAIMQDLQERVYKNANANKIELITPKLTEFRKSEIARRYTENLEFWIKGWYSDHIVAMREVVGKMAEDGKSLKTIGEYLHKEFGVDERHAKFLARNESAIATTSYLAAKYEEEGIEYFRWIVNLDNRERPWHRTLGTVGPDGKGNIYRFDDPPIINEKTGQKGLPGYDYNCRCTLAPIIDKDFFERRRKLYKANNSLIGKVKKFFNV